MTTVRETKDVDPGTPRRCAVAASVDPEGTPPAARAAWVGQTRVKASGRGFAVMCGGSATAEGSAAPKAEEDTDVGSAMGSVI